MAPGKYTIMLNLVEQISIKKLLQYAAMPPTAADALDMVELGRDVDANGVKDPIIIWVNIIERTIRLDSGNHRVYMMPLMGWTIPPYFREQYDERPSLVIEGILD